MISKNYNYDFFGESVFFCMGIPFKTEGINIISIYFLLYIHCF